MWSRAVATVNCHRGLLTKRMGENISSGSSLKGFTYSQMAIRKPNEAITWPWAADQMNHVKDNSLREVQESQRERGKQTPWHLDKEI